MRHVSSFREAADYLDEELGAHIRLATPLGLGKPNQLLNEIYDRIAQSRSRSLKIYTALSLRPPRAQSSLEKRFLEPFALRQWGANYPILKYFDAAVADRLPKNIEVHEFYFQPGVALQSEHLQRHYQSVNYTHVAENILRADVGAIVQLVAERNGRYSLSCNPDLTLDVADLYRANGKSIKIIGVIHPELPFLSGEAEIDEGFFDIIVSSNELQQPLFALPRQPIAIEDHLIGFYSSLLVRDGGTIQIGIGSLSDAVVAALGLRQSDNRRYREVASQLRSREIFSKDTFVQGLYGLTEMLNDGFMHLRDQGILKRTVQDELSGLKTYLHGSFVLGSHSLYEWLRNLSLDDSQGLRMSRVSRVNDLYDPNEVLLRHQRVHGRFFNTTMQMSLLGEAMSETRADAAVISGVGGQYNFVSMARELKEARSVIMLRSARYERRGRRVSNIVWRPGHVTIPRHLRDIVVTEYGVADLRGKSDEECIQEMLNITDSQFQDILLKQVQKAGKICGNYRVPEEYRSNTPQRLRTLTANWHFMLKPFPFGSDFTPEEERLVLALQNLKSDVDRSIWQVVVNFLRPQRCKSDFHEEIGRMNLANSNTPLDWMYRRLLRAYLSQICDHRGRPPSSV